MIPGIVASQVAGAGAAGETYLDFVNGVYVVDGETYPIGDLLASAVVNTGTGTFQPGLIEPGRGMPCRFRETNEPIAIGPLRTKFFAPYAALVEWEDTEEYLGECLTYVGGGFGPGSSLQGGNTHELLASPFGRAEAPGYNQGRFNVFGTNRAVSVFGTDDSGLSVNGGTPISTLDMTGEGTPNDPVFEQAYMTDADTEVFIFGWEGGFGLLQGWVRRIDIIAPIASGVAEFFSDADVPATITTITEGATTANQIEAVFTTPADSDSVQYWARAAGSSYPNGADDEWLTLDGDKIIKGLDPATSYDIVLRAVRGGRPAAATPWASRLTASTASE